MRFLGNLVWLIFGGFFTGVGHILGGLLLCVTIIGIPFGIQAVKLGVAVMAPFGKEVQSSEEGDSPLLLVLNVIWIVLFGWEIAVTHLTAALLLAVTIVGLPFARQHLKLIPLALLPFGRDLRPALPV